MPESTLTLTGNLKDDYYSGAVKHFQLACWEGFWCTVHLMHDGIIVVYDESSFHRFFSYTFQAFLTQNIIEDISAGYLSETEKNEMIEKIKTQMTNGR